jgi:hypothetical protein
MAKGRIFTPQGLPDPTPCPTALTTGTGSNPPPNFTPAGIDPQPTADPLANFIIKAFVEAEVPPVKK